MACPGRGRKSLSGALQSRASPGGGAAAGTRPARAVRGTPGGRRPLTQALPSPHPGVINGPRDTRAGGRCSGQVPGHGRVVPESSGGSTEPPQCWRPGAPARPDFPRPGAEREPPASPGSSVRRPRPSEAFAPRLPLTHALAAQPQRGPGTSASSVNPDETGRRARLLQPQAKSSRRGL